MLAIVDKPSLYSIFSPLITRPDPRKKQSARGLANHILPFLQTQPFYRYRQNLAKIMKEQR